MASNYFDVSDAPSPRWRPWRELAHFTWLLTELSWIALWGRLMLRLSPGLSYLWVLFIFGLISVTVFATARLTQQYNVKLWLRRASLVFLLCAGMLLALQTLLENPRRFSLLEMINQRADSLQAVFDLVPAEFIMILVVCFLAWRALVLAGQHVEPSAIIGGFRNGIVAFFIYALLGAWQEFAPVLALLIFLFSSLAAMSASRIAFLSHVRGGQAIAFDRRWLAGIVASILIVVSLALAVAQFMAGRGFIVLSAIATAVIYVVVLVLTPVVWLGMEVIAWLSSVIDLGNLFDAFYEIFMKIRLLVGNLAGMVSAWFGKRDLSALFRLSDWLAAARPWLMWGTILVVVIIVLLSLRKTIWRRGGEPDDQEVEALLDQPDLLDMLKNAVRRGWERMRDELERLAQLRQARRLLAAARIRRIYAHLMDLSERLGQTRQASCTPLEFLPRLENTFPALDAELSTITTAYLRVRYGELPERAEEVDVVESAWSRVKARGQQQLREQKRTR